MCDVFGTENIEYDFTLKRENTPDSNESLINIDTGI